MYFYRTTTISFKTRWTTIPSAGLASSKKGHGRRDLKKYITAFEVEVMIRRCVMMLQYGVHGGRNNPLIWTPEGRLN